MTRRFTWLILLMILLNSLTSQATDYYWKGGSGNYNDPTMWWLYSYNSGTTAIQAPISSDDVYFTAAAFTATGAVVTLNANANCHNMVWDDAIVGANAPTLSGAGGINLDVYGGIHLATNMTWSHLGPLHFRSTELLSLIDTKSHGLGTQIYFEGTDSTEFKLVSPFVMADRSLSVYSGIQLNRGYLNANGYDMTINSINLGRTSNVPDSSIGINLSGTTVTLYRGWWVGSGSSKFHTFNMNNSHIHCLKGGTYWVLNWGANLEYDTISTYHSRFRAGAPKINHLYSYDYLQFYGGSQPVVDDWHIGGNAPLIEFYYGNNWVTVDTVFMPNECDKYVPIRKVANPSGTQKLIKKSANANLNLSKAILQGIDCDITMGRTYTVVDGVDAGGNSPNWQFVTSAGRELYFRATTNNLWSNPNNWEIWDGTTFQPNLGACLPTPIDHVYFDSLSFTTSDTVVLIDSVAYCHNMYWFDDVRANSSIRLNQDLLTFGSIRLSAVMGTVIGPMTWNYKHTWDFYGKDPDTIITNGVMIQAVMNIVSHASYQLADNFTGFRLYGHSYSRIEAENIEIRLSIMALDSGYYNNVYAWLNAFAGGTNMDYQGTTTYEFDPTNGVSQNYFYGWNGYYYGNYRMPNVILNKQYVAAGNGPRTITIEGDWVLKEGASIFNEDIFVTGAMSLYSGDIYVKAGYSYSFTGSCKLTAADTLHAIGDCVNIINWASVSPMLVNFGYADIQYNFIRGWNNTGSLITANNSIDGGANTNVDFPASGGTTFYWRASSLSTNDFEGDWNDPTHWTTNPNDSVGSNLCLPTIADTVIFDNLSLSIMSNGCSIADISYCNTLIAKTNIIINGNKNLYIANSLILEDTTVTWAHSGTVNFVGDATTSIIDTRNIYINSRGFLIDNALGIWNVISPIRMKGGIVQSKGNLYTNANNLTIGGYQHYGGHFDFQNSYIHLTARIFPAATPSPWVAWRQVAGTIDATGSTILTVNNQFAPGNATYHHVIMNGSASRFLLLNGGTYQRLDIFGAAEFRTNNTFDTLVLHGGNFYYLYANTIQTLTAPYGVIEVADVGPGQFVNIESNIAGQKAYFHKEYGKAFCVDWIKVRDNEGTKGVSPPIAWAAEHSMLQFETGENSDNIGGTATGIWNFEMPPILTVTTAHSPIIDLCAGDTTVYVPITMTGTYPYSIIYSWTDVWGNNGLDTIVVVDSDSNVLTPFVYQLELHPMTTTTYNLDIAALRCGGRNFGAPITTLTAQLPVDTLVETNKTGSCLLTNNSVWAHFVDDLDQRPMLSILDKTSATDYTALGLVNVQTNFDPTIKYWNGLPYLPRHWKIDPTTNGAGKVRLYFTQNDLDFLQTATVDQNIDPATELILYKFDDTITVGMGTVVPFTVIPLTGIAADPFATTTAVFAIEFEVSSFSGFLLQPTTLASLPLKLLNFEATKNEKNLIDLNWQVADATDASYYELERSQNGIEFEHLARVEAGAASYYSYEDKAPYSGTSYYRLKLFDKNQDVSLSPIKTVTLENKYTLNIYPNPIQANQLQLQIINPNRKVIDLRLYNSLGQLIVSKEENLETNSINHLKVELPNLPAGGYILKVLDKRGIVLESGWLIKN